MKLLRMRGRLAAVVAPIALVGLLAAPSSADTGVNIDYVEQADDRAVKVLLSIDGLAVAPDLGSVKVSLNGKKVDAQAATVKSGDVERTTILAIDASNSMKGDRFEAAKAAAKAFIAAAPSDVAIGMVTFAGKVKDVVEPTTDHAAVTASIDSITLSNGTSVYDAVLESVSLAGDDGARSILLLSDGKDQGKGSSLSEVVAAAGKAAVVVDVVSLDQKPAQRAALEKVSSASGGTMISADPGALSTIFAAQADALSQALVVTFSPPKGDFDDAQLAVSLNAGSETFSDDALVSLGTSEGSEVKVVEAGKSVLGDSALLLGGIALGLGLALLLGIFFSSMMRGKTLAQKQIALYADGVHPDQKKSKAGTGQPMPGIRETALSLTDNLVRGDFESRLTTRLNGAGSSFTASEWLLLHGGIAALSGLVGLIMSGAIGMFGCLAIGALAPWLFLKFKHGRRLAAFNSQLAETLQLTAGGLSAGRSMPQAIDTVVREGAEPMAGELRRALIEQRLGVEISDALDGIADRMESQDFAWVVMAIRIQREVGGNLAELLTTVADTLREREYLRRQVRVLSAEGRMSAWVLGSLPIIMFFYLLLTRPEFITPLFTQFLGLAMLAAAVALLGVGFFWLSRIVKVEV